MNKKVLTIATLFAVSLGGLAACNKGGSSVASSAASSAAVSSAVVSSVSSVSSITPVSVNSVAINNKTALQKEWHIGEANRMIELTVDPEVNIASLVQKGQLTVTSSDTSKVAVNGLYLSPVGVGKSNITVTIGSASATVEVEVSETIPVNKHTDATVASAVAAAKLLGDGGAWETTDIYTITGFAANVVNSKYGNFDIYDPVTGDMLVIYGSSTTNPWVISKAKNSAGAEVEYSYVFKNPQNFKYGETFVEGDLVTIDVTLCNYHGKYEGNGHVTKVVKNAATIQTYKASITAGEHGTATLAKTEGLKFNESVAINITPDEGYVVDKVTADGTKVNPDDDGNYVLKAKVTNAVEVTFKEKPTIVADVTLNATALGVGTSYGSSTTDASIGGASWKFEALMTDAEKSYLQMSKYTDSRHSSFANTSALSAGIDKIVMTYGAKKSFDNENALNVKFGTDATVASYTASVDITAADEGGIVVTVTPDAKTYTFVSFEVPSTYTKNAQYWASVEIYLAK